MKCLQHSILGLLLLLSPSIVFGQAESMIGYWEGAQVLDGAVRLMSLDINAEGDELSATLSMPDFGMIERKVTVSYVKPDVTLNLGRTKLMLQVDDNGYAMRGKTSSRDSGYRSRVRPRVCSKSRPENPSTCN